MHQSMHQPFQNYLRPLHLRAHLDDWLKYLTQQTSTLELRKPLPAHRHLHEYADDGGY